MIEMKGKELRDKNIAKLKEKVETLDQPLGLAVIQIGNDEASNVYVGQKEKMASKLGYNFIHKKYKETVKESTVLNYLKKLNKDDSIDGIIVQMPIPEHLDTTKIQNAIDSYKDVDGLTFINAGRLVENMPALVPCTPKGILDILEEYNIELEGKNVVVIGRSILVGKPIANLLTNRNATVTLCHSKSKNIEYYTKHADIVIVAVGKASFLKKEMVKEGCVVVDVGITRVNGKLHGDVDDEVRDVASYLTPVPGGCGPMTVYELMKNVYVAHKLRKNK